MCEVGTVRCGCDGGGRALPVMAVVVGVVAAGPVLAVLGLVVTWLLVAVAVVAGSMVAWWAVREVTARRRWARACREAAAFRRAALPAPDPALPAPASVHAVAHRMDRGQVLDGGPVAGVESFQDALRRVERDQLVCLTIPGPDVGKGPVGVRCAACGVGSPGGRPVLCGGCMGGLR